MGMVKPIQVGEDAQDGPVYIPRYILGAGVTGTSLDLHPISGESPEVWKQNSRGYNLLLRFGHTLPGFAQHVKDIWGEETQYVAQTEMTLGKNLNTGFADYNNVFVPSQEQ